MLWDALGSATVIPFDTVVLAFGGFNSRAQEVRRCFSSLGQTAHPLDALPSWP